MAVRSWLASVAGRGASVERLAFCAALAFLLTPVASCRTGESRPRVTPDSSRHYEWRSVLVPQQLRATCEELFCVVELSVGYAMALEQPPEGFCLSARLRWNGAVRTLCAHFDRLYMQHDEERTTSGQFEQEQAELMAAIQQLAGEKKQLEQVLADCAAVKTQPTAARAQRGEEADEELAQARASAEEIIARAAHLADGLGGL